MGVGLGSLLTLPNPKNKLDFVNGKLVKLEDNAPEARAWEKANSMAIAWLYNVIDKNFLWPMQTEHEQSKSTWKNDTPRETLSGYTNSRGRLLL